MYWQVLKKVDRFLSTSAIVPTCSALSITAPSIPTSRNYLFFSYTTKPREKDFKSYYSNSLHHMIGNGKIYKRWRFGRQKSLSSQLTP